MNETIKAKWVRALKSDDYEQGRGYLNLNGKFCCLGVLCDLAVKDGVEIEVDTENNVTYYDESSRALPHSVRQWAGIEHSNPMVQEHFAERTTSLAELNDAGKSFNDIAYVIERCL